jgi:hypothetical protein
MTRSVSVGRSFGAWPLKMFGCSLLALLLVGCAGSLPPELLGDGGGQGSGGNGGGGNGGGSGGAGVMDVTCSDGMKASVKIIMTCGQTAICHDATAMAAGGLVLNAANVLAANLVDKKAGTASAAGMMSSQCKAYPDPYLKKGSNPAMGLFLEKLKMTPACGASMPFAKPVLPQTDIDCLTMWATANSGAGI